MDRPEQEQHRNGTTFYRVPELKPGSCTGCCFGPRFGDTCVETGFCWNHICVTDYDTHITKLVSAKLRGERGQD